MRGFLWLYFFSLFTGLAHAGSESMAVVGLDESGQTREALVPAKEYKKRLVATLKALRDESREAFEAQVGQTAWKLKTVVFGVATSCEFGLKPIGQIKVVPRFRVAFGQSATAPLP